MRIFLAACVVASLVLVVGCGGGGGGATSPTSKTGSIKGVVYAPASGKLAVKAATTSSDPTRQPVAGATVTLHGYPAITTKTDDTGAFLLQNVPAGKQTLDISFSGYTTLQVPVKVIAGTQPTSVTPPNAAAATYKWTVLVYMAADNNLEPQAILDCKKMERVGSNKDVEVLVQFDRPQAGHHYSSPAITADANANGLWSGARRYQIDYDPTNDPYVMKSTMLDDTFDYNAATGVHNCDMGNPQTLNDFITWGQTNYPAQHYLLVVWNHGSGWDPYSDGGTVRTATTTISSIQPKAVAFDDTSNDAIRDAELSSALTVRDQIDVFAMDACLMGMAEVAYQVRHQAGYMVASEEETPVDGFAYTDILQKLTSQPSIAPADLAKFMESDAFNTWNALPYYYATSSAIDLSQMQGVADALSPFAQRLKALKGSYPTQLTNAALNTERFSTESGDSFADLMDYAYHFYDPRANPISPAVNDDQLRSSAQQLESAISRAVLHSDTAGGHPGAHGLSIYFPSPEVYNSPRFGSANVSYPQLEFSTYTHWGSWLAAQPPQM